MDRRGTLDYIQYIHKKELTRCRMCDEIERSYKKNFERVHTVPPRTFSTAAAYKVSHIFYRTIKHLNHEEYSLRTESSVHT